MPELPEVETIRRGLSKKLADQPRVAAVDFCSVHKNIYQNVSRAQLKAILPGKKLLDIARVSKTLLFDLGTHLTLTVHLGMTGRLLLHEESSAQPLLKHTHLKILFT